MYIIAEDCRRGYELNAATTKYDEAQTKMDAEILDAQLLAKAAREMGLSFQNAIEASQRS